MSRAVRYLGIPDGGLRWAAGADAIEQPGGHTFALASEVVRFLEGFASRRPLMHLGHVLHFMQILRRAQPGRHDFTPLNAAWNVARWPARTAGVLAAELCRGVPAAPDAPTSAELAAWLAARHYDPPGAAATVPPLTPEVFEDHVAAALARIPPADLVHWFRHGEPPPGPAGERLADEIARRKPPSLSDVLADVSRHQRLRGAVPHVAKLEGALSLPPRRLEQPRIKQGGYSDITSKGGPEQLLPSQFALEELEFLRRWAENELLYFRREEPHRPVAEELVLLIDQGVRAWGSVRLLLTAAAFALARQAEAKKLTVRLAGTSRAGPPLDPLATVPADVADLLAGSDLSPHPGEALEPVLESVRGRAADVVLLTHPRALVEADVQAAARVMRHPARLFAVTADDTFEVGVHQIQHGSPVPLGRFRLDQAPPPAPTARHDGWGGDVERIGHPFRFGLQGQLTLAMDYDGEWLLASARPGMLLLMNAQSGACEMLPRPVVNGEVLREVPRIIGVAGGFVIPVSRDLFHYDLVTRRARAIGVISVGGGPGSVRYRRREHALIFRDSFMGRFRAVHLADGRVEDPAPLAWGWVGGFGRETEEGWANGRLQVDEDTGTLYCHDESARGARPTVLLQGAARLRGLSARETEAGGGVVAATFGPLGSVGRTLLGVFRLGDPGVLFWRDIGDRFAHSLSADGGRLAVGHGDSASVLTLGRPTPREPATPVGGFHNNLSFELGADWLAMRIGSRAHVVRWDRGLLEVEMVEGDVEAGISRLLGLKAARRAGQRRDGWPGWLQRDPSRWRACAYGPLVALLDCHGQLFLCLPEGGEVVAAFFAYKKSFAAWLPDGTVMGPERLTGRAAGAAAPMLIGKALQEACRRGRPAPC